MSLTQAEFEAILADTSKRIGVDIEWTEDEDHSPAVEFRMDVHSDGGYPLLVRGSYNALAKALSYVLLHRGVGRIYALDLGKDHHNPTCDQVGEKHKHRWSERFRDKEAYVPDDITAGVLDPVGVWRQFCAEARIDHTGALRMPPLVQRGALPVTPCEAISKQIGELFVCSPHDEYVRVRTPFMYPDGDMVDLFVAGQEGAGALTLTDLGETLRWLRMQTGSVKRSPKQRRMIEDVCLTQGTELFKGMLLLRVNGPEGLAKAVVRLGEAAVRVSDLWFTLRARAAESLTDEVAEFLTEREIAFDRGARFAGRSGRWWPVDFQTRTPTRSALTYVLTTGSRASARGVVEHVVAAWYDLSHLTAAEGTGFVSLFDDTVDVWAPEDFRQLEPLSSIARWSRPDEFEGLLKAA